MKTYKGIREVVQGRPPNTADEAIFLVIDENGKEYPLDPRFDLVQHSPTGMNFSYGGSGPAQLACAMLADHFGDDEKARDLYMRFKNSVISGLDVAGFTLTSADIDAAIAEIQKGY